MSTPMASWSRSTFSLSVRSQPSSRAFPSDDRVLRKAARARPWLYSGQSRPASAVAFRVSTSTGTPSRSMRGAPSNEIVVRNKVVSPVTLRPRYYAAATGTSQRFLYRREAVTIGGRPQKVREQPLPNSPYTPWDEKGAGPSRPAPFCLERYLGEIPL